MSKRTDMFILLLSLFFVFSTCAMQKSDPSKEENELLTSLLNSNKKKICKCIEMLGAGEASSFNDETTILKRHYIMQNGVRKYDDDEKTVIRLYGYKDENDQVVMGIDINKRAGEPPYLPSPLNTDEKCEIPVVVFAQWCKELEQHEIEQDKLKTTLQGDN